MAGKQIGWGIVASHLAKIKNPAKIGKVASVVTTENDFVGRLVKEQAAAAGDHAVHPYANDLRRFIHNVLGTRFSLNFHRAERRRRRRRRKNYSVVCVTEATNKLTRSHGW
jgi:hypothetical protein